MLKLFLLNISLTAALTLLLFSCRQPIDLDTDRTVVPTNLPEITDFSPKAGLAGRVSITGKNFVNVRTVKLDTLTLDSVVVESPTLLHAYIPYKYRSLSNTYIPIRMSRGVLSLSVTTKRGTSQASEGFVYAHGTAAGKITLNKQPLDSTVLYVSSPSDNFSNVMAASTPGFPKGWYLLYYGNDPGTYNTKEAIIHPFKSGYTFFPVERRIVRDQRSNIVGGQDFEAIAIPSERLPSVTSVAPNSGKSFGWQKTGTTIILGGTGLTTVKKVVIVIPYPSPELANPYATTLGYTEAKEITIDSDSQITVKLPQLDGTKAIPGRTYNCQMYLLLENGSYLAPQRISITYL